MVTLTVARDCQLEDEAAMSPLEGAVVGVQIAKRRADAASQERLRAESADAAALKDLAAGVRDFLSAVGLTDGRSWRGEWIPGNITSIESAADYFDRVRDAMLATARKDEQAVVALPDGRALRRLHAAAKSLRYHAARIKEGK